MSPTKVCATTWAGLALLLAVGITSAADTPPTAMTGDGHQQTTPHRATCEQWDDLASCKVSWYRLLANPSAYRGKVVGITGYLARDFGNLVLYPDKADYVKGNETDSILLERPFAIPKNILDKAKAGGCSVFILGRFSTEAEVVGFDTLRTGGLYDIHKIISAPWVPSDEPLDMNGIHILPPGG